MKKLILLFLFSFAFFYSSRAQEKAFAFAKLETKLDSLIKAEMETAKIPSIALGIVYRDTVLMAKAYGHGNVRNETPATPETVYQLGSVTKMFTGNLLAHLINDQVMSLKDKVADYFPADVNFPADPQGNTLKIQHLATHSAVFPRYPNNLDRVDPEPIKGYSIEKMYQGIGEVKPTVPFGSDYLYSNFGYGVLGIAMERATEKNISDLFNEYIFSPGKMEMSFIVLNSKIELHLATPYLEVDPLKETEAWDMGTLSTAGNMFSNINDMNKFMILMLKENNVNQLQQQKYLPINDTWNYGLGCFVISSQKWETTIIYHGGDVDGYASSLSLYPESNLGFTILTNYGEGQIVGEVFSKIGTVITETLLKITNE